MQFTKTPEQLAARRARVKEMMKNGQVETDALRKQRKEAAKYQKQLEDAADLILTGLRPSKVIQSEKDVLTREVVANVVPEANSYLSANDKTDTLAQKANTVLQELLNNDK